MKSANAFAGFNKFNGKSKKWNTTCMNSKQFEYNRTPLKFLIYSNALYFSDLEK